jgi:hypothetical protein
MGSLPILTTLKGVWCLLRDLLYPSAQALSLTDYPLLYRTPTAPPLC